MNLSVETYVMRERFSDETAIEMIKKAGFDCYDYSMYWMTEKHDMLGDDYAERAEKLRAKSDELGIVCNQAHAPFEMTVNDEFDMSNSEYRRLVRSLEAASVLGANNIIVHVIKNGNNRDADFYELNRRFYQSLAPYCDKFNICVSVENLFHWDKKALPVLAEPSEHIDFVKSLHSPWFNVCIDVGHSAITGYKPEEVISSFDGNMLKALHIHDNDFVSDKHLLPYTDGLEWNKIMSALAKIQYKGELTFELTGYLGRLPNNLLEDGLMFAEKVGRQLIAEFERNRFM